MKTPSGQDNKVVKNKHLVLIYKIRGKLEHLAVFLVEDFFFFGLYLSSSIHIFYCGKIHSQCVYPSPLSSSRTFSSPQRKPWAH